MQRLFPRGNEFVSLKSSVSKERELNALLNRNEFVVLNCKRVITIEAINLTLLLSCSLIKRKSYRNTKLDRFISMYVSFCTIILSSNATKISFYSLYNVCCSLFKICLSCTFATN